LIGANFSSGLLKQPRITRKAGFEGGQQRRGELDVGQAQIAESRITLVVFPATGLRDPGRRIGKNRHGNAITFPHCRVEGPRAIAIVVAGETTVVPRPGGNLARQKPNCARLGNRRSIPASAVTDAPAGRQETHKQETQRAIGRHSCELHSMRESATSRYMVLPITGENALLSSVFCRVSSRRVAADVSRRISARKSLPLH